MTESSMAKGDFETRKAEVIARAGPWVAHNIITPVGYTISEEVAADHFRLQRFLQLVSDCQPKSTTELRVIDFGCHEGMYSIEFARQGAEVIGIEGRHVHLEKARFLKDFLGLDRLSFHQDDVRNFHRSKFGSFDVAVCTGILYHLEFATGMKFLEEVCNCSRLIVVDTHVGLSPEHAMEYDGRVYWGHEYAEFRVNESDVNDVLKHNGAAIGNEVSFWLTRGSLFNALLDFGCTTVCEVGVPVVPGQFFDRVTFVGIRGRGVPVMSAPASVSLSTHRYGAHPSRDTAGQSIG